MKKIAIVGTGIAGLSAAHLLQGCGKITLFEKSRGVSGRASTRRSEPYFFDHGAQSFTVRTRVFQDFIDPFVSQGVVQKWTPHYVKFDGNELITDNEEMAAECRYVGVPGMSSFGKSLAEGFKVHMKTKIVSSKSEHKVNLQDETGRVHAGFDWVICTVPPQQAVDLLPISFKGYSEIEAVGMESCIALMLGFSTPLKLDFDAARVMNSDLSWIAVNSHKPGRSNHCTLVVHTSSKYAQEHIDCQRETLIEPLVDQTSWVLGKDVGIADHKAVHIWRYAKRSTVQNSPFFVDEALKLAVCGDWCVGERVEDAFISAYRLVDFMKKSVL